jgi:hypothetical protein
MEKFLKQLEWKQIAAVLLALGVISTSDQSTALISVFAMLIVAMINLFAKFTKKSVGRGWVSLLVYSVAFGLAIVSNPTSLGTLPIWQGDAAKYTEQLAELVNQFGPIALTLTGSATILYNALSRIVFDKIEDKLLPE